MAYDLDTVQPFFEVKSSVESTTSLYAMNENPTTRLADISYNLQRIMIRVLVSSMYSLSNSVDDRVEVWKSLFPGKSLPQIKKGAAMSNFGILNREIKEEVNEEEFENLLRQIRSA